MYQEGWNFQLKVGLVNSDVVQPDCQSMKPHKKSLELPHSI